MIENLNTDAEIKDLSLQEDAMKKYISKDLKPEIGEIGKNLQEQESMDKQQQREIKAINDNLGLAGGQRSQNGKINQKQSEQIAKLRKNETELQSQVQ